MGTADRTSASDLISVVLYSISVALCFQFGLASGDMARDVSCRQSALWLIQLLPPDA